MGVRLFLKKYSLRVPDSRRTHAAELSLRESLFPVCLITVLFFLWGFSYGLLDTLNKHFQTALNIDRARSAGLQAAYFGAYPLASIGHAAWILRHLGYRAVFIWGLCLYAIGALLAIPALKARSFGAFCACIFIIGNGLGSLETAANPFITVCGPPRYSEIRVTISQAFNGVGTVVAPVLGSYVFFTFSDETALDNVQWVYLSIANFVLLLASAFFFANIPEITDADMAFQVRETHINADEKPFSKQYRLFHAAAAQFCYTGAQIAIASFFINYATGTRPDTDSALGAKLLAGAQAAFAVSRFGGAGLMTVVRPRYILIVFLTCCIIFVCPTITQGGDIGISLLFIVFFFESICFPTILGLGMRGLGRHTKRGSGYIIAGISGGACVPQLTGLAGDRLGDGTAMFVPLIFFLLAWSYPICANFCPAYVRVIDQCGETDIGVSNDATDLERSPQARLSDDAGCIKHAEEGEEEEDEGSMDAKRVDGKSTVTTAS